MRIVRFRDGGEARFGIVEGQRVTPCTGGTPDTLRPAGAAMPLADVTLLPPSAASKMVAIWGNSRPLQDSRKAPATVDLCYVIKPPSSFITDGDAIVLPRGVERVIFEGELGIVIARRCRHVAEGEADQVIAGWTIVNEVTATGVVQREPSFAQHTRAKGFDTFGVFGPAVETAVDVAGARIRTWQNGELRQDFAVADLIRGPHRIIAELSADMTLEAGDVIACGSSLGVAPMQAGDRIRVEIDGLGALENPVVAEKEGA